VVVAEVEKTGADPYIADRDYRRRDPAFASADYHKVRDKKGRALRRKRTHDQDARARRSVACSRCSTSSTTSRLEAASAPRVTPCTTCDRDMLFNGYRVAHYKAPITACRNCLLRAQRLRNPHTYQPRQSTVIKHREGPSKIKSRTKGAAAERMRRKFDTPQARAIYSKRMQTVEPVFANLQNKGMRRFILRDRSKVNAQWQLFTMVHNIDKIAHQGVWS
jgi:Transposase DDE domain